MSDSPENNNAADLPEVSTEAARRALDAMSEQLVQKLNRMIEEQDARVREFAVQNPSLSSLPATPKPIQRPAAAQSPAPDPDPEHAPAPPEEPPVPKAAPLPPSFPPRDITPQEAVAEFERRWKQNQRAKKEKRAQEQPAPPVPSADRGGFRKPALPAKKEKKETGCGTWAFFIVVLIILIRACTEA